MQVDMSYLDRIAELTLYARLAWCAAGLALLAFCWLMLRRREAGLETVSPLQRAAALHSSRDATASMEYLMVLVPFLVIVMTVWQLAFMINAKLHVSYATYAAARSAAVMIPAELEGEEAGTIAPYAGQPQSKWARIQRAARPGTIAVSPGHWGDAGGVYAAHTAGKLLQGGSLGSVQVPNPLDTGARLVLMSMHMCDTPVLCEPTALRGTRPLRTAVKDVYAENMTTVRIQGMDSSKKVTVGQDVVNVRVDYVFWLQVPWVGRLFAAAFTDNSAGKEAQLLNPYPSMTMSEETSIYVWQKKRAVEPCT